MNHSPGPWHACNNGKCSCKMVMAEDYPICTVEAGDWGDTWPSIRLVGDSMFEMKAEAFIDKMLYGNIPEELAAANARLIAAAPDLFQELTHLVRLLEPMEANGTLDVPGMATLNGARAALRKAVEGDEIPIERGQAGDLGSII